MAYDGNIYSGGTFSSNCLDDVPFKLGPKFIPPTKVLLPPGIDLTSVSRSRALNEEYSFEVEEAVLKWSAEKQKQDQIQREKTLKRQTEKRTTPNPSEADPVYENQASPNEQPIYENPGMLQPQPFTKPNVKPKTEVAFPLIANISNSILTPLPSSSVNNGTGGGNDGKIKRQTSTNSHDIDLAWFEKEDDPFDNLELQTINDMEELASVLNETSVNTKATNPPVTESNKPSDINGDTEVKGEIKDETESDSDNPIYENVELKAVELKVKAKEPEVDISEETEKKELYDLNHLPPVPARQDLVGRRAGPLPPIKRSENVSPVYANSVNGNDGNNTEQTTVSGDPSDNTTTQASTKQSDPSFQTYENVIKVPIKPIRPPPPKPAKPSRYSRHDLNDAADPVYDNHASVKLNATNSHVKFTSNPTASADSDDQKEPELNFVSSHFGVNCNIGSNNPAQTGPSTPPPRPDKPPVRPSSSNQSWNRYSPLPPTSGGPPLKVALPGLAKSPETPTTTTPDPYSQLSEDARSAVDNIASMGFPKDRVVRAVEKLGPDGKEVVEYLCLVDQLTERGYSLPLAENALIMFKNSMNQASTYLELFTQLQELGFNGDKIKEALVNTNNDREKTLDILTASS